MLEARAAQAESGRPARGGQEGKKRMSPTATKKESKKAKAAPAPVLLPTTYDGKYTAALEKIGGRLKLTSIIARRLKELRLGGLKQKGSFNDIIESIMDEILTDELVLVEPKKHKK